MITNKPLIAWEKWKDPFIYEDDPDGSDITQTYDDGYNTQVFNNESSEINPAEIQQKSMKMVATPYGIIPLAEHSTPGKLFNFWMGHTTFPISRNIFNIIENTLGVETLDVFTPYRMRIGIGKLFVPREVMNNLTTKIYNYLKTKHDSASTT